MSELHITPKLSIGSKAWFIHKDKVVEMPVWFIKVEVAEKWTRITYSFQGDKRYFSDLPREIVNVDEEDAFPSKKALLESL